MFSCRSVYHELSDKKQQQDIIDRYGTLKAFDFTLTNLKGKTIKLSDYKGKMVVLDFWATWCAPCRASFPAMQNLVNEFKGKEVEFFFVDTFQEGAPAEIKKEVAAFIKKNPCTFNVLLDYKKETSTKYKIEFIPSKIVVDKNGNIIGINNSADNLKVLLNSGLGGS